MIKLTCEKCGKFAGFLREDGTGPLHEECLKKQPDVACPIVEECRKFLAPCRPTSPGNPNPGGKDLNDWGSYYDYAMNSMDHDD